MTAALEAKILVALGVGVSAVALATARAGGARRGLAFLLAWLLPGAGHAVMGRWRKGLFFMAILSATYLFGLWIVGFRSVSFDENPFYYVGQYGSGLTLVMSKTVASGKSFPRPELTPSWYDPGLLYVCVAGLLNLVLMLNVLELRPSGTPEGPRAEAPPPAPEEKPA